MQELSQWFNLSEQKPWAVGIYEVNSIFDGSDFGVYSFWDGIEFKRIGIGIECAMRDKSMPTMRKQHEISWRGLSSDPSKTSHKPRGNRRVTRYVVMANYSRNGYGLPYAVFTNKENADAYVEAEQSNHFHKLIVKTIRFRTPEASQA